MKVSPRKPRNPKAMATQHPEGCEASFMPSRWPERNPDAIHTICERGPGLADLWEASPVRIDSNIPRTDEIVDTLFPGNPLLCCGWSRHRFETRPRSNWHKLDELELIVPSPMTEREGITKEGKLSQHALANTGRRRFLIIEMDAGEMDQQAAILLHLAEMAPLALVVHSGGKSLHGWFYCDGIPEESVRRFMEYAVFLGADDATWTPSQFVRMPDGRRVNARRQAVYFFNPFVIR